MIRGGKIDDSYIIEGSELKVNAVVNIPTTEIKQGKLKVKEIDIEKFSSILCPEITLQESGRTGDSIVYIGGSAHADLDYNTRLEIWKSSGAMRYDNYQLDDYFRGNYIEENEMTMQEQDFSDQMANRAKDILAQLGIQAELMGRNLYTDKKIGYCWLFMNTLLDDYQLVDSSEGEFLNCNIAIADIGINVIEAEGMYEIDSGENVKIISLEKMLDIIKESVLEKNINTYEETITDITLAYMVKSINGSIDFFPIWCLSGSIFDGHKIPFICIDARNGDLVYMR